MKLLTELHLVCWRDLPVRMGEENGLPDTNRRDLNRARAESADDELEACPEKLGFVLVLPVNGL